MIPKFPQLWQWESHGLWVLMRQIHWLVEYDSNITPHGKNTQQLEPQTTSSWWMEIVKQPIFHVMFLESSNCNNHVLTDVSGSRSGIVSYDFNYRDFNHFKNGCLSFQAHSLSSKRPAFVRSRNEKAKKIRPRRVWASWAFFEALSRQKKHPVDIDLFWANYSDLSRLVTPNGGLAKGIPPKSP